MFYCIFYYCRFIATDITVCSLVEVVKDKYYGPVIGDQREKVLQIINGLNHMHVKGILHQALQPENILVSYPNGAVPPLLKLANFGFLRVSSCLDPLWKGISLRGKNEKWMAPEIYSVEEEEFTKRMELFSLGLVLGFSLSGGRHVFQSDSEEATVNRIKKKMPMTLTAEHLKNVDDGQGIMVIIQSLVSPEPLARPSAYKVLKMSFFTKPPTIGGVAKKRPMFEDAIEDRSIADSSMSANPEVIFVGIYFLLSLIHCVFY